MPEDIGLLFKQISDNMSRKGNAALKEQNLTISQMRMLEYLAECGNSQVSQHDLEEFFRVSHVTIIGLVKRLADKGLVATSVDTDDRRVKLVTLTEAGKAFVENGMAFHAEMEGKMLAKFSDKESKQLAGYLKRIRDNIS